MSGENLNDELNSTDVGSGAESGEADDLASALSDGGDAGFVIGEEKKPMNRTTLVLMLIVALGGGGLYLMYRRAGGPQSVAAAPASVQANKTITQFLSSGDTSVKNVERLLANTRKMVEQFLAYPSVNQVPLNRLATNPFRQSAPTKDGESSSEAEARRRREEDRAMIKKAADGLVLQSILHGARKACMINNTMVTEGQTVEGFKIEKINPNSVVVQQSGYKFEIQMASK